MDSSHMGLVHQYSASNTQNARPIPTRSQTSPLPPEFEFSLPSVSSVRPGLAKIGRRISEMSDNFLYENDVNPEPLGRSMSVSRKGIPRIQEEKVVPFMGDEPVFCPFCEKPLPPGLLSFHGHHEEEARLTRTPVFGLAPNSTEMTKATSAPETTITNDLKPLMNPLPVTQPSSPAAKEPRMTSVELGKPVRVADEVDNTASKVTIDVEDIRRWAKVAGIELDLPPPPTQTIEPILEPKPFPKLAPPPEDQGRASSRNASKFGFFGGKSKEGDEDEDSDDDTAGAGGYAKLNGPASPETIEKELAPLEHKERKEVPVAQEADVSAPAPTPASEQEIRDILKEVLSKVNTMSQSHTAVLHSHSSLLTTLKITRSNLAMAEANAEMLEEQLKRQSRQSTPVAPGRTAPVQSSNPMAPPPIPFSKAPMRPPIPLSEIKTSSTSNSAGTTPATSARPSTESSRPQSIQIPNSNIPRTPGSASSESGKGVFGFWSRNKDKVGEFMANLPDLTPTAERSSYDFNRPPESPSTSTSLVDRVLPGESRAPGLNRSNTVHGRAGISDSLQRSSSYTGHARNNVLKEPASSRQPMDPYTQELTRLRTAHSTAQSKIETMSKELAVLKKGKIDMEAELENLSQALFEEANKMVADERKARAELEESLKEVKDEREALRETIKVLGGQVEDKSSQGDTDEDEEVEQVGKLPKFQPRDLDKHYEALRKSIHHVADHQDDEDEDVDADQRSLQGLAQTTKEAESGSYFASQRRHSLPGLASPEPQAAPALHDPWADTNSASGLGTSAGTNNFEVGSMSSTGSRDDGSQSPGSGSRDSQSYDEQLRAEIELESPKRDKIGL